MKTIKQAMLETIYEKATEIALQKRQTANWKISEGEETRREYYITLEQLENILKEFEA